PRQSRPLVAAAPHPPHHRLVVSQHTQLVPALPRTLRNPAALFLLDTACRTSRSPITLRRYSGPCTHHAAGPAAYAPTLCSSFLLNAPAFSSQLLTTYSYLDTFPLTKKRKDISRSIHPLSQVKRAVLRLPCAQVPPTQPHTGPRTSPRPVRLVLASRASAPIATPHRLEPHGTPLALAADCEGSVFAPPSSARTRSERRVAQAHVARPRLARPV
ncbi:hypothetical protein C8J57DRAFT_1714811, partial [Mycena rebaudengoi]